MEKIDQILDSLYDRVIEPIEAKEQLLDLFTVSNLAYDFCDHLNTYDGMEEIRFDFMIQDFIDKSQ